VCSKPGSLAASFRGLVNNVTRKMLFIIALNDVVNLIS
jgi:hypothetical protein